MFVTQADTVTATNEVIKEEYGISIVNPVENSLIISNEKNINSPATLSIYDLNGRQLLSHKMKNIPEGNTEVPISQLSLGTGIYIYQIETAEFRFGDKILKQ